MAVIYGDHTFPYKDRRVFEDYMQKHNISIDSEIRELVKKDRHGRSALVIGFERAKDWDLLEYGQML